MTRNREPCPDCGGGYWQEYIGPPPSDQYIPHASECVPAEIQCCGAWVPYPAPGRNTSCPGCGTEFALRTC